MTAMHQRAKRLAWWSAGALGLAAGVYAVLVAVAWRHYGQAARPQDDERDPTLDQFMPLYDVAERHHVHVAAPPAVTLAAAVTANLWQSAIVRAIFKTRELVLGASAAPEAAPHGLLAYMQSIGWRVLAQEHGREVVMGAITQPWAANVTFRGLAPEAFKAFREPGYVKIAWTLRADRVANCSGTLFFTETRVLATDPDARARFRWYWARFSPGIVVIRKLLLRQVRKVAEGRAMTQPTIPSAAGGD
jgi:hypothetical protein